MFGEQSIYGQSTIHLDDKKRIILPKFTYAQAGDSLLVVDNYEYLSIHREENYTKKIIALEELYENSVGERKKTIELELLKIYSTILKKVTCDKQGRIALGDITDSNEIRCIGAREYLILKPQKK